MAFSRPFRSTGKYVSPRFLCSMVAWTEGPFAIECVILLVCFDYFAY